METSTIPVALLIFVFFANFATAKKQLTARQVVDNYIEAVGGKKAWKNLETRKLREQLLIYQSDGLVEVVGQIMDYGKYYVEPNTYLDFWAEDLDYNFLFKNADCHWFYQEGDSSVMLIKQDYVRKKDIYPNTGIFEILNLEMIDSLIIENDTYRVDFQDDLWSRKVSVFFDKNSFLVKKHTYINNGRDLHEYYYSDYREIDGLTEPYVIDNYVHGTKFKSRQIQIIEYNLPINLNSVNLPQKCLSVNKTSVIKLDAPLKITIN